jgi:hypothetical protein
MNGGICWDLASLSSSFSHVVDRVFLRNQKYRVMEPSLVLCCFGRVLDKEQEYIPSLKMVKTKDESMPYDRSQESTSGTNTRHTGVTTSQNKLDDARHDSGNTFGTVTVTETKINWF